MEAPIKRFMMACIAGIALLSVAEACCADEFNAEEKVESIYGGAIWKDDVLAKYFRGYFQGYITPAFSMAFTEDMKEKQFVFAHITPEPVDDYSCHACSPLIGGAVFIKSKDGWNIESATKIIDWGNGFGGLGEKYSLVKIGPDKYGAMIRIYDVHGGYETQYARIITAEHKVLSTALEIGFVENPGSGACENVPEQYVHVKFVKGENPQYFDAITNIKRNDGECGHVVTRKLTNRYVYKDGKYEAVSHH